MRRGLTLIEVLASLILLGSMVAVIVPWIQLAGQLQTVEAPRLQWQTSAYNLLQIIQDDMSTGDYQSTKQSASLFTTPKITVSHNTLQIQSRHRPFESTTAANGPCVIDYKLDQNTSSIHRNTQPADQYDTSIQETQRIVLTGVTSWACEIDHEQNVLLIMIEDKQRNTIKRVYDLKP